MKLVARYDSIGYRVPGGETLWLEIDGRLVGVHSRSAYEHADGTAILNGERMECEVINVALDEERERAAADRLERKA